MSWSKLFRIVDGNWLTNLAIWAILLLPILVYANVSYPFEFGRFLIFMYILPVLLLGLVLERKWLGYKAWWRSPLLWLVIIWLLVTWIFSIFGVNFHRSLWGIVSRSTSLLLLTGLTAVLLSFLVVMRRIQDWIKAVAIMTWVGGLSAVFALLQSVGITLIYKLPTTERVGGLMGNPIFLATFLILTLFFALYLAIRGQGWVRWLSWLNVVIQIVAIMLTASRGPFIGLVVGLVAFGLAWLWINRPSKRQIVWGGGLAGLGIIILGAVTAWLPIGQRLIEGGLSNTSIQVRLITWGIAWKAFLAQPWTGYGWENIEHAINEFYNSALGQFTIGQTVIDRSHNVFFDQLLTNGILGGIILVVFVIVLATLLIKQLAKARANDDKGRALLVAALLATGFAYLITHLTGFDVVGTILYATVLLGLCIFLTSTELADAVNLHWWKILSVFVLIPSLIFSVFYLPQIGGSARASVMGDREMVYHRYEVAHRHYNQAQRYPRNPYLPSLLIKFPNFSRLYAVTLINNEQYATADSVLSDGLVVLEKIRQVHGDNVTITQFKPILLMLLSYIHADQPEYLQNAKTEFNKLVAANPNREYLYINWMRVLMDFDMFDEAYEATREAEKLTDSRDLIFWRGVLGMRSGRAADGEIVADFKTAAQKGISFQSGDEPSLRLVVDLLVQNNEWESARYYQGWIVHLDPFNAQDRINLSAIYANLGLYDLAEKEARKVLEIDPSRQSDVTEFLQSIGRAHPEGADSNEAQ